VRKPTRSKPPLEVPAVDPAIIESAKQTLFEPKPRKTYKCRVCGSGGATEQSESLCWVCRRLKISAWRDIEQQMPMAE
jgi:hypothetical protein